MITKDDISVSGKYDIRKKKDNLSRKYTWKYDVFFKCSEKMVFTKKSHWNMISFVISGKMVFPFSR